MASKFLEDWYNKRRDEFYSHVRPEHRALAERKERITKAELPATMNSYERRIIDPNLDNTALLEKVEYCIRQSGQELGEFECPRHYNDAVERLYAPLLVKRLREAEAEIKKLRMGVNVYRELTDAVNKTSDPPGTPGAGGAEGADHQGRAARDDELVRTAHHRSEPGQHGSREQ